VATFAPAMASMEAEFAEAARARQPRPSLRSVIADGAMEALRAGDAAGHNSRVAEAAARLGDVDTIMLAHFSTARAIDAVRARVRVPVVTSPGSAVARLRTRLGA